MGALSSTDWTVIDILRVGYERSNQRTGQHFDHPATLLTSVREDSTSWDRAYAGVARCHRILQRHGIRDVPVEMKEAALVRLASPPAASLRAQRLHSGGVIYPVEINHLFSTGLEVPIARPDQPSHEGTKCLYLCERGTGKILALTCWQVALDKHQPNEDYLYDESDPASRLTMIQHGDGTHRNMMALITSQKSNLECSKTLLVNMAIPDDEKRKEMSVLDGKVAPLDQAKQTLASVEDHTSRIFCHVLFSPKLSNEVNGTYAVGVERLRGWALIELHANKYHVPLHTLENRVAVPQEMSRQ
ncbi:hypothetical protein NCS56_01495400 [Fusarium sp. Ph1]|nr:hypothetical protein NCS56_01495400 [Fusarium sp. Ph1]